MTRAEILDCLTDRPCDYCKFHESGRCERWNCVFEEKPDDAEDDAISRHDAIHLADELKDDLPDDEQMADMVTAHNEGVSEYQTKLSLLPPVTPQPKMGHCKDCKWWKDSDGAYRRGIEAESQCPINNMRVFEGNGYCYMFEPKMQEVEE